MMKIFTKNYSYVNRIPVVSISILLLLLAVISLATNIGNSHDEVSLQLRGMDSNGLNLRKERSTCIHRGRSCNGRSKDCCNLSVCRCNLWGINCRCKGKGLFKYIQKK